MGVSWSGSTRLRAVTTISSSAEMLSAATDNAGVPAMSRQQPRNKTDVAARSAPVDVAVFVSDMKILPVLIIVKRHDSRHYALVACPRRRNCLTWISPFMTRDDEPHHRGTRPITAPVRLRSGVRRCEPPRYSDGCPTHLASVGAHRARVRLSSALD